MRPGEFAPFKYLRGLPTVSRRSPQTQSLMAWMLAIFQKRKQKNTKSVEEEKASERSAASWDEGFDLILKLLECYHKNDIGICIGSLGGGGCCSRKKGHRYCRLVLM